MSRTAILHPNGETYDVSRAIDDLARSLTQIAADPKKPFGELVRERRRAKGLPVPAAGKTLPFARPIECEDLRREQVRGLAVGDPVAVAEQRMSEAWWELEAAHVGRVTTRELELLEEALAQALKRHESLL